MSLPQRKVSRMIHEEVARFSELSGEDAHSTSISRIGGYLDGYEKGREDAFTQILMYLNDASLAQSGKCYDCTQELMKIIERMEGEKNDE